MSLIEEVRSFRQRVLKRLGELEPLVEEYRELKRIAAELGLEDAQPDAASADRRADEPASTAAQGTPPVRSGRARGRGRMPHPAGERRGEAAELGERVLAAVRADPGKAVADYAGILGVAPTQLYRPVRELTTEGALVKRARQLYPG